MTSKLVQVEIDYSTHVAANKGTGKQELVNDLIYLGVAKEFIFSEIITFKIYLVCTEGMYQDIIWWFTKSSQWLYSYINVRKLDNGK